MLAVSSGGFLYGNTTRAQKIGRELVPAVREGAWVTIRHDFSLGQQVDVISNVQRSSHVVGDDDAGHSKTIAGLFDQIVYQTTSDGIEAARGFIVNQDCGLEH